MLRIKLVKSLIGQTPRNRATVAALGLKKMNRTVDKEDSPSIRGMIHHVKHMLDVQVVEGQPPAKRANKTGSKAEAPKKAAPAKKAAAPKAEAPAAEAPAAKSAVAEAPAKEAKPKAAKPAAKPAAKAKTDSADASDKPKRTTKAKKTED
ncbi:MAG: 50S ribosomal protein L30 [Fimbriimonadaceae bacterium]|nr:50S ribosomal protein L30 [Fimbriimonadaceae bacterium]